MKKFLTLIIAAAATFIAIPEAEARPHYGGGHTYVAKHYKCGCYHYGERYVRYYKRCGTPVWGKRRLPFRHSCHKARPQVRTHYGYSNGYTSRYHNPYHSYASGRSHSRCR